MRKVSADSEGSLLSITEELEQAELSHQEGNILNVTDYSFSFPLWCREPSKTAPAKCNGCIENVIHSWEQPGSGDFQHKRVYVFIDLCCRNFYSGYENQVLVFSEIWPEICGHLWRNEPSIRRTIDVLRVSWIGIPLNPIPELLLRSLHAPVVQGLCRLATTRLSLVQTSVFP